jgi:Integrase core domain
VGQLGDRRGDRALPAAPLTRPGFGVVRGKLRNLAVVAVVSVVIVLMVLFEVFSCLTGARAPIEDWRQDYNQHRPHSALGMMTPRAFAVGDRTCLDAVSEHVSPLGGSRGKPRWNNSNQHPPALTANGSMNAVRSDGEKRVGRDRRLMSVVPIGHEDTLAAPQAWGRRHGAMRTARSIPFAIPVV